MEVEVENQIGKVWLVGAGPGDVGLLTQKAVKIIKKADVIIYDALISLEMLSMLPEHAEWIDAGKRSSYHTIPQEEINRLLVEKAGEGKQVVRLKGGDPFVFGRGGEELELLAKEGIPFEVVPGMTSAVAVPAYHGIPVTHRDFSSSFHVITGHKKENKKLDIDFRALVQLHATLVFLMGVSALEEICKRLVDAGMAPSTPAVILEKGTTCRQRRVVATIGDLYLKAAGAGIESPAVIVVGSVCSLSETFAWYEKKPLCGMQILLTRPKDRIHTLAGRIRELGAQVIEMPCIRTIPICDCGKEKEHIFLHAVQELFDTQKRVCIAFTSPRGVRYFFSQLKCFQIDIRAVLANRNMAFAVIGAGTRDELMQYGIFPDYMPDEYSSAALGLLLLEKLQKDTNLYLFRAETGSDEIIKKLDGEIKVKDIPTYRTLYTEKSPLTDQIEQAFLKREIDCVVFTSASTVKGFMNIFTDKVCKDIHAVCIGEQTAEEARKHGMKVSVAREATEEGIITVL